MRTLKHPLSGAIYDLLDDGEIQVKSRTGAVGVFDKHGRWRRGDLKQCDPHMCVWIADDKLENRFAAAADALDSEN